MRNPEGHNQTQSDESISKCRCSQTGVTDEAGTEESKPFFKNFAFLLAKRFSIHIWDKKLC